MQLFTALWEIFLSPLEFSIEYSTVRWIFLVRKCEYSIYRVFSFLLILTVFAIFSRKKISQTGRPKSLLSNCTRKWLSRVKTGFPECTQERRVCKLVMSSPEKIEWMWKGGGLLGMEDLGLSPVSTPYNLDCQVYNLQAMWPWVSDLTSLFLTSG